MINKENAIEVRDITKKFKVYFDKGHTLKEKSLSLKRNKYEEREVLKEISFDVKKGEAVGLIGHNGCGKSTILKLLTKIMYPDSGSVEINGRVSSLLELGAGFHPDMSGRENIYINASIFGLNKKEIDRRIENIIEFSELEEFIDNPVRTYSSGMYMRLAFSVAINVNADVLLIDEILAVGDVNFQTKCFNKMMEIKGNGTTIVLVSHSMGQIERICDRSIWIQDGLVRKDGNPQEVHREYLNYMCEQRNMIEETEAQHKEERKQKLQEQAEKENEKLNKKNETGNVSKEKIQVKKVKLTDKEGKTKRIYQLGDMIQLELDLFAEQTIKDYFIELNIVRADGVFCYGCSSAVDKVICEPWSEQKRLSISFDEMNLLPGKYHFDLHFANVDGSTICFGGNVAEFEVNSYEPQRGIVYLKHMWLEG